MRISDWSSDVCSSDLQLSSDRLTFQPDWLANISTDYRIEMGGDDEVVLSAGLFGKGKRLAATLNETTPTFLDSYWLTNASIAYRTGPVEVALFANNLFNTEYFESYIEQTTLALAGRSEDRRVGKEGVSQCRSRGWPYHEKKQK